MRLRRRTAQVAAVLAVVIAGTTACGPTGAATVPHDFTTRDSAFVDAHGQRAVVRVAESVSPLWHSGAGWRVGAAPRLVVTGDVARGSSPLQRVRHAVRLPGGGLAIGDGATLRVRVFDAAGRHVRDLGGRSGESGDFLGIGGLLLRGDTLLVLGGPATLFRFTLDGQYAGTTTVPLEDRFGTGFFSSYEHLLADGSLLAFIDEVPGRGGDGLFRPRFGVLRLRADATVEDTVGWYGGPEHIRRGASERWVAFAANTEVASSRDRIFAGDSRTGEIAVHGYDGRLLRIMRRKWPEVRVGRSDAAQYRAAFRARVQQNDGRDAVSGYEAALRDLTLAPALPFFRTILADATGHLWVETYPWPAPTSPGWSVFDPEGRWLGMVDLPRGIRPLEIGRDWLLGVRSAPGGADAVELYPLYRSR